MAKRKVFNRATGEFQKPATQIDAGAFWRNFLDGSPSREEILEMKLKQAVDGIDTTKAIQDALAGNLRNT